MPAYSIDAMGHDFTLIYALVGGLSAALLLGYLAQKLRWSPLVGYLAAGMIVGPHTPGIELDKGVVDQFAEIGVILLMFGVGLHFHLKNLIAVQRIALPGSLAQIGVSTLLGAWIAHALGWGWMAGVVYGMSVSVASTVVLTRVLSDHRELHTRSGHVALGWLVVEDLFTIFLMVLLPVLLLPGQAAASPWALVESLGWTIAKLALLVVVMLWAGKKLIPLFLVWVARTGTRDLFTLAVLVLALGLAVCSASFFGASMVLGAFLSGMVVGQSEFSARAAAEALPMRDAFAVLFFVSVGMMFDPASLPDCWPLALATLGIVLIGKPLAAFVVVRLLGKPLRMALSVSMALAQIGEFTFILGGLGIYYKALPPETSNALIVASVISIALNSLLYGRIPCIMRLLGKWGASSRGEPEEGEEREEEEGRVVVVGFGPAGRIMSGILRRNHLCVTVIEMNIDTVKSLRGDDWRVVYGDARQADVLRAAGIEKAVGLIISSSAVSASEVADAARRLNPNIRLMVHTAYAREAAALGREDGSVAFSGEEEVAVSMAEYLLRQLGATDEQIQRERRCIRSELGS